MKLCPNCMWKRRPDKSVYCVICGTQLIEKDFVCQQCGADLGHEDLYCGACGFKVDTKISDR